MEFTADEWFESILRDPEMGQALKQCDGGFVRSDGKRLPVEDGILSAVYPESLAGDDAKWNRFYDSFAPFYDFTQRILGKMLVGIDSGEAWKDLVEQLDVSPGSHVIEVSPGPGVAQRWLRTKLGTQGVLVALDLSKEMLRQCRKRGDPRARLVHGNAQRLPFVDGAFDALFHFGGVNLFNDAASAIGEFVRVVRPGGLVSWGDEGFSPSFPDGWRKRLLTRMNPGYLRDRPAIPNTVGNVKVREVFGGLGYLVMGRKK